MGKSLFQKVGRGGWLLAGRAEKHSWPGSGADRDPLRLGKAKHWTAGQHITKQHAETLKTAGQHTIYGRPNP
jgi:hypothetical protein